MKLIPYVKTKTFKKNLNLSQKGFSLVEVLLVILIVGSVVYLVTSLPNTINLIGSSRRLSLAKEIATSKLEDIRLKGFENLPSNGTSNFSNNKLTSLSSSSAILTISDCPNTVCKDGEADIKQVSILINWKEKNGDKKVDLTTLITKGGLK